MSGSFVRLEPLSGTHCDSLYAATEGQEALWRFLPYGPFDRAGFADFIARSEAQTHTLFYAICDPETGAALGIASYLRIDPDHGSAEVGHLNFSPALQGTRAATEAMVLMMAHVFELGYRRYEWKCDGRNLASRRAAQRLGFSFEGVFRQHRVVKGQNRDTAWFSVLDREWPALAAVFSDWLNPVQFDVAGQQRRSLSAMTRGLIAQPDPALTQA